MHLRISQGEKKGGNLFVPNNIKPTKNVVKLAVFSMLGETVRNADCLDLYAGSGALGLSALSLGAKSCTFVDKDISAINLIKQNAKNLNFENRIIAVNTEAEKFLASSLPTKYDIVFADPPYKLTVDNLAQKLLNCISEKGVIVYLHHRDAKINLEGLEVFRQRTYGKTGVSILKNASTKKENKHIKKKPQEEKY